MDNADKKAVRNFGLAAGIALCVLGGRLFFKFHKAGLLSLAILGLVFVVNGVFAPSILRPIHKWAMRIARLIGELVTKILLAALFYFLFVPIGLFMRFFEKDLLGLEIKKDKDSYWQKRANDIMDPKQYEKQF